MPQTCSARLARCPPLQSSRMRWHSWSLLRAHVRKYVWQTKGVPKAPPHRSFPRTARIFPGRCVARSSINRNDRSTFEARMRRSASGIRSVVARVRSGFVNRRRVYPTGNLVEDPMGDHAPREGTEHWSRPSGKETHCENRRNRRCRVEFAEPVDTHPWPAGVEASREWRPVSTPVEPDRSHNR